MPKFDRLRERLGYDVAALGEGALCPLDAEAGIQARVLAADHPEVEKAQYRITMAALDGLGLGEKPTLEESRANDIEVVAAMVTEWIGLPDDDGRPAVASPETNAAVLAAMPAWRQKINAFSRNPKNYKRPTAAALASLAGNCAPPSEAA